MRPSTSRRWIVVALALMAMVIAWSRTADLGSHPHAGNVVAQARKATLLSAMQIRPPSAHRVADAPMSTPRAGPKTRCTEDRVLQYRARLDHQPAPGTPDGAIEHALLVGFLALREPDPQGIDRDAQAARLRWPKDLDLAWFDMRQCRESAVCDRKAEWRHLASLDADNAAVWLVAADLARQNKDAEAYRRALHRAATASFYDPRSGTTYLQARRLFATLPMPQSCQPQLDAMRTELGRRPVPSDWARMMAMSMEMAVGAPELGGLSACRRGAPGSEPALRQDCIAVSSKLAAGDTLAEQQIAAGTLIQLTDGRESLQWRERYRQLEWLRLQPLLPISKNYLDDVWANGEVNTLQAIAVAHRRWPPPSGWLPADIDARTLILTGHPASRR